MSEAESNPVQAGEEEEDVPITPFAKKLMAKNKLKGHNTLLPKKKPIEESKPKASKKHDFSIQDIIGQEGTVMFNALLGAAKKDLGLAQTWVHKAALLKFIISCKILFTTGIIEPHELEAFDEPMNAVGNALLELLSAKKALPGEADRKPVLLSTLLKDTLSKWLAVVGPHMPADDAHKAEHALTYFFDSKFILAFLNDKDYADEKTIMRRNAKRLLQPILIPACKKGKGKCKMSRVLPDGDFTGSSYCAKHHHDRYQKIYLNPKFEIFIDGATLDFLHFPDHFEKEQKQDSNLLACYTRLRDFRALTTVAERKEATEKIWQRYLAEDGEKKFTWPRDGMGPRLGSFSGLPLSPLSPSQRESIVAPVAASLAVPGPPSGAPELLPVGERPDELKRVKEAIDAGLHGLNPKLFVKLELLLEQYLKRYFDLFVASDIYKERLRTYQLPEEVLQQLMKEEAAKNLEDEQREADAVVFFADESEVFSIADSKPLDLGVKFDERFKKFEELAEAEKRELEKHQQMYELFLKKHTETKGKQPEPENPKSESPESAQELPEPDLSVRAAIAASVASAATVPVASEAEIAAAAAAAADAEEADAALFAAAAEGGQSAEAEPKKAIGDDPMPVGLSSPEKPEGENSSEAA